MVMPLWDTNPFKRDVPPYVTFALLAINVVVFLVEAGAADEGRAMIATFGVTPAALVRDIGVSAAVPAPLTLLTAMFLHADFMHLLGNMVFLFVFGDDVEEALGPLRFIAFYLVCGIAASLAYVWAAPHSPIPLIGASGAIAGVLAAYLMFRPCQKVLVFVFRIVLRLHAYWVIGGWAAWQLWQVTVQAQDGVAYMAHVGGLAAGAVLFPFLRLPGIDLFACIEKGGPPVAETPGESR
jgi:membrane associated rhomboid family serine protease